MSRHEFPDFPPPRVWEFGETNHHREGVSRDRCRPERPDFPIFHTLREREFGKYGTIPLETHPAWVYCRGMATPRCRIHDVRLFCPVCLAAKGGAAQSEAKAAASRANGKLGGRPRKRERKTKKGEQR
jgi:hypothetical protein